MDYKIGDKIKVEDFDTFDKIINAGYKVKWSSICVLEIIGLSEV